MLHKCLISPIESGWGDRVSTPNGPLFFQDNGAKVLGVAHLDTVMNRKPKRYENFVVAPQLDDRLGVWVLLDLLPKMGVKIDVLLTTGEETGKSTGEFFVPEKEYNWIVEFDRAGDDVVFYQYEDFAEQWDGWDVGQGSFSDISVMDHIGVMAANIGIGYYNAHTANCWADLRETKSQARKFARFYKKHKDTKFPYDPLDLFDPFNWDDPYNLRDNSNLCELRDPFYVYDPFNPDDPENRYDRRDPWL